MKKRLIAAALLLSLSMTACGNTEQIKKDDIVAEVNEQIAATTEPVEADIYVEKVEGITEDFMRGADVSTLLVQEASGVKYYDEEGNEADLFRFLLRPE